jgi:hypothetical protein
MDIFQRIKELLGGQQEQPQQRPTQRQVAPGYEQAAMNYEDAFKRGDINSPSIIGQDPKNFGYAEDIGQYGGQQEDSGLVNTPQGQMPLSSVNPGQRWQNPLNGYSPMNYQQSSQSMTPGITGAVNPLARQSRPIMYSPGEGPRTNFEDLLKRQY